MLQEIEFFGKSSISNNRVFQEIRFICGIEFFEQSSFSGDRVFRGISRDQYEMII